MRSAVSPGYPISSFIQDEIGRILRQVVERKLYRELGFESFERYVQERLDLSPRTARRLVRLARAEHAAPGWPVRSARGASRCFRRRCCCAGRSPRRSRWRCG